LLAAARSRPLHGVDGHRHGADLSDHRIDADPVCGLGRDSSWSYVRSSVYARLSASRRGTAFAALCAAASLRVSDGHRDAARHGPRVRDWLDPRGPDPWLGARWRGPGDGHDRVLFSLI